MVDAAAFAHDNNFALVDEVLESLFRPPDVGGGFLH